jgi:hypothetical protein
MSCWSRGFFAPGGLLCWPEGGVAGRGAAVIDGSLAPHRAASLTEKDAEHGSESAAAAAAAANRANIFSQQTLPLRLGVFAVALGLVQEIRVRVTHSVDVEAEAAQRTGCGGIFFFWLLLPALFRRVPIFFFSPP